MSRCAKPLLLSKDRWDSILKWTGENEEELEMARRREYIDFLNKQSAEIAKDWPNSLENVKKRAEELRRARIESVEKANSRFYKRYMLAKKEDREKMMFSARDTIFKNKDAPKLLLSAVVESVVLKEREEQLKFNEEVIQKYANEQKRKDEELNVKQVKEWHELMQTKKRRRFEKNKAHQLEILKQNEEIQNRNRREKEKELNEQLQDLERANKEMELIKKFEKEFKEAEKQRIWADNEQSLKETMEKRHRDQLRDELDDQLLEVFKRAQCRTDMKRAETEKRLRDEKLRVLTAISAKLDNSTAQRDAKEQANLNRAIKEQEALVERRHQADIEKKAKENREKRAQREQYLRDEAQRLKEKEAKESWELMNRFKNIELYEEYKENVRKENERKKMQFREDMLRHKKEVDERNAKEKADTRYFYGQFAREKMREADNKLLTHAAALIEEAEKNGRPTMPIRKAIDRYCRMYALYPSPNLPRSLQNIFKTYQPWDGSKPDPEYREPEAPVATVDWDKLNEEDEDTKLPQVKTDGLQEVVRAKLENVKLPPVGKKSPEAGEQTDYKRRGPANGLQSRSDASCGCKPASTTVGPDLNQASSVQPADLEGRCLWYGICKECVKDTAKPTSDADVTGRTPHKAPGQMDLTRKNEAKS